MPDRKKILIIDDVHDNLILVHAILFNSHPNYEILTTNSGIEGLEIAKHKNPEVIIIDVFMPGLSGFEVCKELKLYGPTCNIPILMFSAGGQISEVRIEALNSGADAIIAKPFNRYEFIALVNVMLRIKRSEDNLRDKNIELEIFYQNQIKDFILREQRFLQISGYLLEFFWEIDINGLVNYISPSVEVILGYNSNEINGRVSIFSTNNQRLQVLKPSHLKNIVRAKKII